MSNRIALAVAASALALGFATSRTTGRTQDPSPVAEVQSPEDEERAYALIFGRRTFEGNCLICHTAEMAEGLRLTPEQWGAEVAKMIGWGAPVPPEESDGLVAYLADSFPVEVPQADPALLPLELAAAPTRPMPDPRILPEGDLDRGAALYTEHCATCHGEGALGGDLGNNLVHRPILLRPKDFDAVLRGGRHRMPGFAAVLEPEQEADLLAWLRGLGD